MATIDPLLGNGNDSIPTIVTTSNGNLVQSGHSSPRQLSNSSLSPYLVRSRAQSTGSKPDSLRKAMALIDAASGQTREMYELNSLTGSRQQEQLETEMASNPLPNRVPHNRIRINVSGQYFDIRSDVLERHPETLLGNPEKRRRNYDAKRNEYFYDRHRPSFEVIFGYYMYGGRLRRPNSIPDEVFLEELIFFEIERNIVDDYKKSEGYTEDEVPIVTHARLEHVWNLFEFPKSSKAAFAVALVSVTMTMCAIVLLCVETLPKYRKNSCVENDVTNWADPFFIVETVCNSWFTFELIIRFVVCPDKIAFWKDFKNVVDVVAIVPYYVTLFTMLISKECTGSQNGSAALAFLRVIRLVRIFKLTKHSIGLQVLVMTFKASIEGLGMFLAALIVSILLYSSALYYAELNVTGSQIHSIPDAFWWAIITMTTVGYGDKVPLGPIGRLIGAVCAISGILTLAIPVPIIAGHFNRFYTHKTGRARLMIVN